MTPQTRGAYALHEAAHAVVARELGYEVLRVEVTGDIGLCHVTPIGRGTLSNVRRELALILAGWIAEKIAEGGDWRTLPLARVLSTESQGDRRTRVFNFEADVAALLDGDTVRAHRFINAAVPAAAKRAATILKQRWGEVLDLAAQLMVDGEVNLQAAA